MQRYLEGKHALVQGASGAIGNAVAQEYVRKGASALTLTYGKKQAETEALAEELRKQGVKVYVTGHGDRLNPETFRQLLEDAVKANGQEIDIAADNVGWSPDTYFQDQTVELWQKVLNVNLVGSFVANREIGNRMREKGIDGFIVIVTSINGRITQGPYSAPYNASKAGQESLVRDLAIEYAPAKINVNGVAPAWVESPMNDSVPPEDMKRELMKTLAEGQAKPGNVAHEVVFRSGNESEYHHGEIFDIKGGYNLK